jgi:hypothetical protein
MTLKSADKIIQSMYSTFELTFANSKPQKKDYHFTLLLRNVTFPPHLAQHLILQ